MKITNTRPNPHVWLQDIESGQLPPQTKAVARLLVTLTDDDGVSAPGIACLARHSGLPEAAVVRALRDLRITGNVERIAGRHRFRVASYDHYRLTREIAA